jgi:hypothetical protein
MDIIKFENIIKNLNEIMEISFPYSKIGNKDFAKINKLAYEIVTKINRLKSELFNSTIK